MKIEYVFDQLPKHLQEVVKYGIANEGTILFFTNLKLTEERAILQLNFAKLSDMELKDKFKEHQILITHYTQFIYFLTQLKEEITNV